MVRPGCVWIVLFVAGCGGAHEAGRTQAVNLSGFPPAFSEGYAAGCERARSGERRRDERRYAGDADYRMGWDDGKSVCAKRR